MIPQYRTSDRQANPRSYLHDRFVPAHLVAFLPTETSSPPTWSQYPARLVVVRPPVWSQITAHLVAFWQPNTLFHKFFYSLNMNLREFESLRTG